jgi:monovalent cation/proton antiporter MnhG/PhaG subunit
VKHALEAVLLCGGVAVELLCCIGVLRMRRVYDRLHYLAPAGFIGPLLIALAIVIRFQSQQMALKALTILAVLSLTGPVVSRVLARAARVRESNTTGPFADEAARGAPVSDGRS